MGGGMNENLPPSPPDPPTALSDSFKDDNIFIAFRSQ